MRKVLVFIVSICWRKMGVKEATEICNSKCHTGSSTLGPQPHQEEARRAHPCHDAMKTPQASHTDEHSSPWDWVLTLKTRMASRWILEFPKEAEEIIEQQRYVTLIILGPAHWFFLNLSHGLYFRICEDVYREE